MIHIFYFTFSRSFLASKIISVNGSWKMVHSAGNNDDDAVVIVDISGKYFSLMFNSLDDQTWINIISKLHSLDFELIKVETLEYSANSVVQDTRKAGLKTDFIITFQKQPHSIKQPLEILTLKSNRKSIKAAIKNLYTESEISGFATYQILNHLFRYFLHQNQFFKISEALILLAEDYHFKQNKWQPKNNSYAANISNA